MSNDFKSFIGNNPRPSPAALNVLCLDIWRGSSSGPAVHSLHSVFSVGAFLAPLASRPYLSVEIKGNGTSSSSGGGGAPRMEGGQEEERRVFLNSTVAQQQEVRTQIRTMLQQVPRFRANR